ncbi:MAG TPA: peptide chain release factor N(5)-glutamine methyltransferase [Pyrinomonadaceae bacterium]|nr:peptide chain release factor N(5)-glutamine methyltransferase [Pyrinomonadaceae bacterium]
MPISIAEAILQGANKLRKAGVPEARREAGSLLAFLLDKDRTFILSHADDPISGEQETLFQEFLESRAQGEPAQYITGRQDFYGLEFEVTPAVLIPRPETELLIEAALKLVGASEVSFCDVGTGSGCIAITLLTQLPLAHAIAVDVSASALEIAKRNAARHKVSDRIEFVLSDCFASVPQQTFDLIVSNPPYVAEDAVATLQREVRDFEPRVALTSGADGLDVIRRLVVDAQRYLKPRGHLLFEIGFDQHEAVGNLIDAQVWELLDIHQDLQGIPRTVALRKK